MDVLTVNNMEQRAAILDGARIAEGIKHEVAEDVMRLQRAHGIVPCLAVVQVGDDPASTVYVGNKVRTSRALGLRSEHYALAAETTTEQLLDLVRTLNKRDDVDGILVQSPLPREADELLVLDVIDPAKDVDGFHPINVGRLILGQTSFVPCTPAGILELLKRSGVEMRGARACVIGRSHIVGRPVAQLLLQNDATVTICHSRTQDLPTVTREADILISAIGRPGLIRREHIKPGATVIDVGMNRVEDESMVRFLFGEQADQRLEVLKRRGYTLVGDVHPAEVETIAGRFTPVPGGVGPLTIAMLMRNTVLAAHRRRKLKVNDE